MKEESSYRCDWSLQAAMQLVSKARSLFTFIKHENKYLSEQEWKRVHYLFVPRDVGRAVSEIRLACWSVVIPPVGRFIWLAPLRQNQTSFVPGSPFWHQHKTTFNRQLVSQINSVPNRHFYVSSHCGAYAQLLHMLISVWTSSPRKQLVYEHLSHNL